MLLLSEPTDLTLSVVFSSDSHVLVKMFTTVMWVKDNQKGEVI